jgi:hypothetical protein
MEGLVEAVSQSVCASSVLSWVGSFSRIVVKSLLHRLREGESILCRYAATDKRISHISHICWYSLRAAYIYFTSLPDLASCFTRTLLTQYHLYRSIYSSVSSLISLLHGGLAWLSEHGLPVNIQIYGKTLYRPCYAEWIAMSKAELDAAHWHNKARRLRAP